MFQAVHDGAARLAMVPVENTVAGRVADIHHLLPNSNLHIIGEHFERVNHRLLAPKGATLETLETCQPCSCVVAVPEDVPRIGASSRWSMRIRPARRRKLRNSTIRPAVRRVGIGVGDLWHLQTLRKDVEDDDHNTTRFLIMAKEPIDLDIEAGPAVTTFIFRVRNVSAALYKALGGFATEWRQHDQARILYGRRRLLGDNVLCGYRRPSG